MEIGRYDLQPGDWIQFSNQSNVNHFYLVLSREVRGHEISKCLIIDVNEFVYVYNAHSYFLNNTDLGGNEIYHFQAHEVVNLHDEKKIQAVYSQGQLRLQLMREHFRNNLEMGINVQLLKKTTVEAPPPPKSNCQCVIL